MHTRMFMQSVRLFCVFATLWTPPIYADTGVPDAKPPDLVGAWYLRIRTATDARIAIIGNTHIKATTHLLTSIREEEGQLMQKQQTCIVDTRPSRSITRTVLPKAFIDHLPVKSYPIQITQTSPGTWSYDADLQQQYVGYDGTVAKGRMPQKSNDPAVFDWDEDGKPGASVLIDIPIFGKIRVYMLQTNHTVLKGTVTGADRIEGTTQQLLLKQRTIGADNRLLAANPTLSIGEGHDKFEMVRIPPESTCADIARLAKGTF